MWKEAVLEFRARLKHNNYTLELYEWAVTEDGEVCEDCKELTSLPPMDLADWMNEDLPYPPPPEARCKGDCRCKLTLCERRRSRNIY